MAIKREIIDGTKIINEIKSSNKQKIPKIYYLSYYWA